MSCVAIVAQAMRASPKLKGWIFVSVSIAAIGGIAYSLRPDISGYIAGGLWAIFILGPALAQRSSRRWTVQQKYDRAARPAMIAGILHPFDGVPQMWKLLRALSLADQGKTESAIQMLEHLENTAPTHLARSAAVHCRRLKNDWAGLISWVESSIDPKKLPREHSVLPMYIRAMGETGQLGKMLYLTAQSKLSLHPQLASFRGSCRLFTFAFCGQPARVAETFNGPLSPLPQRVQQYWIATANYAAAMTDLASAELSELETTAESGLAIAIQYRRANPPQQAGTILTDSDNAILEHLELEQEHERRFSHTPNRGWRPWVTFALVVANVLIFAAEWSMGARSGNWLAGGTADDNVLRTLGSMNGHILQTHQFYRLFMANFLHFGYAHILMNMLALLILGPFVLPHRKRAIQRKGFAVRLNANVNV